MTAAAPPEAEHIRAWLAAAEADADRRGLPVLALPAGVRLDEVVS